MTIIEITNPYYDKEYRVKENTKDIEHFLACIRDGYEPFMILHTENDKTITINPSKLASFEILGETK